MVTGSARKVRLTKPPNVTAPQARKNSAKNRMPRPTLAPRETGARGVSTGPSSPRSLEEARVDDRRDVGHALDDAELEQELARLLAEGLDVAGEELFVGLAVLPAQIGLRLLELLARLLHHRPHHVEALLRLLGDHL